ncbi:MAG: hypothetical protein IJI50_05695 [Ruminococcus sp.]|nr:hypothetical protein [Ruminococcus sp.]
MRKLIAILMIICLCVGVCGLLSGCDHPTVKVSSAMEISDSFSGTRTITVVYPLSAEIDGIKDMIAEDAPADISGAAFTYVGVKEDGYYFELALSFGNKTEYEAIVSELVDRNATAFLSRKNTSLTSGTRMSEDFDVKDLIGWMVRDTQGNPATKKLEFDYSANSVRIGTDVYETGSTVNINDCTGSRINSVSIKTSNDKEGSYSRTFTFSLPNETYLHNKSAVEAYFLSNTSSDAQYTGWSAEGSNMIYTAIFENLDIKKLSEVTSMLLDTDSVEIFYGDRDNASTPLSEGLTFEENLDTFSFIGAENGFPKLEYAYSLPTSTIHGDGSVFADGQWKNAGTWEDGVYKVELTDGSAKLRIPDGIQYFINGVNFHMTSLGDSRFRRTTEFLYSKSDGYDAMNYANNYFISKGAVSETAEDENNLICRVSVEGTTDEITAMLVKLFGSGNFVAYRQNEGFLALTVKTELTDYVNIGYMLNSANANRPMVYYVDSEGGDNIVSVSVNGSETAYTDHGASSLPIEGGVATVEYHGNIPITAHIVIYVIIGAALLALTAFVCIMLLKPKKKRRPQADPLNNPEAFVGEPENTEENAEFEENGESEGTSPSLDQTTTFSIFELGALARNKKYVDEINKDVEERLHAQSLEDQKHDIRARELEELSRKVYGEDADSSAETTDAEASAQAEAVEPAEPTETEPQESEE